MKFIYAFILIYFLPVHYLVSQSFTEVLPRPYIEPLAFSGVEVADVNGDGNLDIFIEGKNFQNGSASYLYFGNGAGDYLEKAGFYISTSTNFSAFSFADIDGDSDLDFVGMSGATRIYTNDGTGKFRSSSLSRLESMEGGTLAFADIDGDNDPDLLIAGKGRLPNIPVTILYENDGSGVFTEKPGNHFEGVTNSSVAFSDIDGDSDLDLFICGITKEKFFSKLYRNDGAGFFLEDSLNVITPVGYSAASFADIDGDLDADLLVTGQDSSRNPTSILYLNDGAGIFTKKLNTPFQKVILGTIEFSDIDNDNDLDVCLAGQDSTYSTVIDMYINDGLGNFQRQSQNPFSSFRQGDIAFLDIDKDQDQDLLIIGVDDLQNPLMNIYMNDGNGAFHERPRLPFEDIKNSCLSFFDADADKDQDVLISGENHLGSHVSKLYINDGAGTFIESKNTPFIGVVHAKHGFSDFDGDGDIDILITGRDSSNTLISSLYLNDGSGSFFQSSDFSMKGTIGGHLRITDLDGDAEDDIFVVGQNGIEFILAQYINDGTGNFSVASTYCPVDSLYTISADFGDIDGDGDLDVIYSGNDLSNETQTKLLLNDGSGAFSKDTTNRFYPVYAGEIVFNDIDLDNDLDVIISGIDSLYEASVIFYSNNGSGVFTEMQGNIINTPAIGHSCFSDIDNDGDDDLFILAENGSRHNLAIKLYLNNGLGSFSEVPSIPFLEGWGSFLAFADIDGDDDQDALISGGIQQGYARPRFTKLFTNDLLISTSIPQRNDSLLDFTLYPNPFQNPSIYISFQSKTASPIIVRILDNQGGIAHRYDDFIKPGLQNVNIKIPTLKPGVYLVQLISNEGHCSKKLIIK